MVFTATTMSGPSAPRAVPGESRRLASPECAGPRSRTTTTRVGPSVVAVSSDGTVVGFVEAAGTVFVTLAGDSYDRAVEVGQSLDLAIAVALLEDHS